MMHKSCPWRKEDTGIAKGGVAMKWTMVQVDTSTVNHAYLHRDLDVNGLIRQILNDGETDRVLKVKETFFKVEAVEVRIFIIKH